MYGLFWIWVNVGKHPCFTDISISFPYSLRQGLILFLALEVCKQTHISNGSRFRWKASVRAFVEANQVKMCKAIESVIIAEAENSPFSTYLKQKYEVRCLLDIKTYLFHRINSIESRKLDFNCQNLISVSIFNMSTVRVVGLLIPTKWYLIFCHFFWERYCQISGLGQALWVKSIHKIKRQEGFVVSFGELGHKFFNIHSEENYFRDNCWTGKDKLFCFVACSLLNQFRHSVQDHQHFQNAWTDNISISFHLISPKVWQSAIHK